MARTRLHTRPGRNGNPPHDFTDAAYAMLKASRDLETLIKESIVPLVHGRNYQHLPENEQTDARTRDVNKVNALLGAVAEARDLGEAFGAIGIEYRDKN